MKEIIKKRKYRPMFFIDIAVPRDIDPDVNNLDNVYLYDIDDLKGVVNENLQRRSKEAELAQDIIAEEVEKFEMWLKSLELNPTIKDLLSKMDEVAKKEVHKTLKRLGTLGENPDVKESLNILASSLVKKFSHYPIAFLKNKARRDRDVKEYISLIRDIFNLD
jgi:glutamyl-tRNA reductase